MELDPCSPGKGAPMNAVHGVDIQIDRDACRTANAANAYHLVEIEMDFIGCLNKKIQYLGRTAACAKEMRQAVFAKIFSQRVDFKIHVSSVNQNVYCCVTESISLIFLPKPSKSHPACEPDRCSW